MTHQPLHQETKASDVGLPLYRIPCACGWRGCWYAVEMNAFRSFAKHVERTERTTG